MDYDFEAPTYVNFAEAIDDDEEEVSRYFDVEHEESFTRAKGTPGVVLPEGPRDVLPSNKKSSDTVSSSASKMNTSKSSRTTSKGRSPAKVRTPLSIKTPAKTKTKTPGSVKRLNRIKTPVQTPGKMAAAFTSLILTPSNISNCDLKRERVDPEDVSEVSPRKRLCIDGEGVTPLQASKLVISPPIQSAERIVLETCSKKSKWIKGGLLSVVDGIEVALPLEKQHTMETRADKAARDPPIQLRSRSINRANSENTSESISKTSPFHVSKTKKIAPERFISLAEATQQFHRRTPLRFRARPRNSPGCNAGKGPVFALKATIPQSPALRVKHRNRPISAVSRDQQEELELMKIRQNKIKPLPLPEHILKPLNPRMKVDKKLPTLPEPFKITEIKKKEPVAESEPVKFTARPVPKKILQGPIGIGEKQTKSLTDPKSPTFLASALKRCKSAHKPPTPLKATQRYLMKVVDDGSGVKVVNGQPVGHLGVSMLPMTVKSNTQVKPFSFEERDKNWMKKKEEKLRELEEQLKPKPGFHAKPVPSYRMRSTSPVIRARTPGSQRKNPTSRTNTPDVRTAAVPQFKARTPTVLSKKPFEPVKPNRQLPLPDFTLASEIRAKDRELFDQQLMKKEMELKAVKQQLQTEKEMQEKEEIALLRKQTVHKSIPVPNVKPFQPHPSDKSLLTDPTTPFCLKRSYKKMH